MTLPPKRRDTLHAERAWAKAHPYSIKTTYYKIVTPTLARLERAAMRVWRTWKPIYRAAEDQRRAINAELAFWAACAAHAAAKAKRGRGK